MDITKQKAWQSPLVQEILGLFDKENKTDQLDPSSFEHYENFGLGVLARTNTLTPEIVAYVLVDWTQQYYGDDISYAGKLSNKAQEIVDAVKQSNKNPKIANENYAFLMHYDIAGHVQSIEDDYKDHCNQDILLDLKSSINAKYVRTEQAFRDSVHAYIAGGGKVPLPLLVALDDAVKTIEATREKGWQKKYDKKNTQCAFNSVAEIDARAKNLTARLAYIAFNYEDRKISASIYSKLKKPTQEDAKTDPVITAANLPDELKQTMIELQDSSYQFLAQRAVNGYGLCAVNFKMTVAEIVAFKRDLDQATSGPKKEWMASSYKSSDLKKVFDTISKLTSGKKPASNHLAVQKIEALNLVW